MQKIKTNRLIYSASDLVNFTLCPSITLYDLQNLETPLEKAEEDPYTEILQEKGIAHEKQYLDRLIKGGHTVADISAMAGGSIPELVENTVAAMTEGADIIYQACLQIEDRIGHIDFLEKAKKSSRPGCHAYEVTDTKLSKKAAPKHIVQLCFYSELLEHFQGTLPEYVHLKLGDGRQASFYLQDYYAYYKIVRSRYERFLSEKPAHYPIPCSHCGYCSWRQLCKDRWTQDDHLSLVADIRNVQIKKLEDAGIKTLAESVEDTAPDSTITEYEQALVRMREALGQKLPKNREDWGPDDALFHLAGLLLVFYRRADKPAGFFADPRNDQRFDYLFVDEAGQVSLANMVAMAVSAKNIVLLGDQMQLGQPIQGRHPEDSGESVLDFLMDGYATVPENRGIFLPKTYRMHPDITRFISEVSYNGRLTAETQSAGQGLIFQGPNDFNLPETGIRFIPCLHDACSQSSIKETEVIRQLILWLEKQSYRTKTGDILPVTLEDILIVAPYNMQVNLLQKELPSGARIGTVDKFQGQEAEIVIVSMTTSSQEYLPRYLDFLFSRKRLNVALSRARCLAIIVANPRLLETACNTVEQMGLINTLCRAYYAGVTD